jgi:NTP pyrophosphatase (non-canonical NTP hydrolase)
MDEQPQMTKKKKRLLMRAAVLDFGSRMEAELRKHDGNRTWDNTTPEWLLDRLMQERDELRDAIIAWRRKNTPETRDAVRHEAADVGNFAMMIHDLM